MFQTHLVSLASSAQTPPAAPRSPFRPSPRVHSNFLVGIVVTLTQRPSWCFSIHASDSHRRYAAL